MRRLLSWLQARRHAQTDDLRAELDFHREQLEREHNPDANPAAIRTAARLKLGNTTVIEENVREMHPMQKLETAARHFLMAFRSFRRHRGAYLFAIGILALGVGMSVAMFSILQAVVLNPLPFADQDNIVVIWKVDPKTDSAIQGELAYPELLDLQANIPAFESVAVMPPSLYGYGRVVQIGNQDPLQVEGTPVSPDFFRVLGVKPALGRDFAASDSPQGAEPVVILSHSTWRDLFHSDRNIIGKQVRLNGTGTNIIGVMPPGVEFHRGAGLWVPLTVSGTERRGMTYLQAIARLKPGFTRDQVAVQVNSLFERLAREHPRYYSPTQQGVVKPIAEYWTGSARQHLWLSLGASVLLLLAACVSAGNLFLSRAIVRRREIATRASLGASTGQILAQLSMEGLAASVLAAGGGLLLAWGTLRILVAAAPADIPRLAGASLDWPAFVVAAGGSLAAAMLCSVAPAWLFSRMNLEETLRQDGARAAGSLRGTRMQQVFITAQTALTVALLSLSLFLFLSYRAMMQTDVGFANRDTVTMNLNLRGQGIQQGTRDAFYTDLITRLRRAPGVTSAAAILLRPLEGSVGWDAAYQFEAELNSPSSVTNPPLSNYEVVTPGYFETVGTGLLEGRDFDARDTDKSERVAVISHTLAAKLEKLSRRGVIGQRLRFGSNPDNTEWWKIIGVVADARYRRVTQTGDDIFVPYLQANAPTNYLVVRGSRPATELVDLVRQTVAELNPNQALAGVATLDELIRRDTARHRFNMILLLWFGSCAMALAAAGVFSVISESVAARTREIAIKLALGATRPRILRETASGILLFVAAGELAGAMGGWSLARAASDLLYSVSPADPIVPGMVCAFLFAVSAVAAVIPAWLAGGRDPRISLQAD